MYKRHFANIAESHYSGINELGDISIDAPKIWNLNSVSSIEDRRLIERTCHMINTFGGFFRSSAKFEVLIDETKRFFCVKVSKLSANVDMTFICSALDKEAKFVNITLSFFNDDVSQNYFLVRFINEKDLEQKNSVFKKFDKKLYSLGLKDFAHNHLLKQVKNISYVKQIKGKSKQNFIPNFYKILNCIIRYIVPPYARKDKNCFVCSLSMEMDGIGFVVTKCKDETPDLQHLIKVINQWTIKGTNKYSWPLVNCTIHVNLYNEFVKFTFMTQSNKKKQQEVSQNPTFNSPVKK